ncbi:hypothetical protein BOX15_Mlig008167g1, partial [Macrostomum lignano]
KMPGVENQKRQQTQHVLYGDEYVSSELLSEYQTLQRQLKILESDRRLHSLEAAEVARQQRADLRRLEEENGELRRNLAAARSRSAKRERQAETSRLRELVGELEALEAEVRSVREAHMQLDAKIREARKRVRQTRVARGGTGAAAGAERSLQETIVLYEKKLESRCVKYQTMVWENAKMRESLDHLRADRQKFLSVRERLQAELQRIQRRRAGLTESATEAYRDSEDSRRRVRELQERENATAAEHALRVKLLYREIDLHDHIGSFMRAKLQHRETDPELRHLREELQRRQADERRSREADDESLRRSFDLMRRHYGAADLDGMVRCFLHAEDENFSLFRFCTTAQSKVEELRREVDQLSADIRDARQRDSDSAADRSQLLTELASQVAEVKADRLRRSERLQTVTCLISQLYECLASLAQLVGVSDPSGGGGFAVRSPKDSLLRSLGSLEARVLDLLALRVRLLAGRDDGGGAAQSGPPRVLGGAAGRRRTRRGTDVFGAASAAGGLAQIRLPDVDEFDVEVRTASDRMLPDQPLTKEQIMQNLMNQIAM